ncbi:uncharacterized protein [Littorina saxatilis]|uniref:EF-hand domain-containing protein n=1 Tax=Littorina saxatilis TaxID=31220 RepID=A0AAN9AYG0_9CAEN
MTPIVLLLLALSPLALGSSEPQREAILFNQADQNKDGQLTQADLRQIFLNFDVNKDSSITQAEFVNDWTQLYTLGSPQEAATLFGRADTDKDGAITDKDLPAIFSFFDMDGNGLVDQNEFLTQWGDLRLDAPDTVVVSTMSP